MYIYELIWKRIGEYITKNVKFPQELWYGREYIYMSTLLLEYIFIFKKTEHSLFKVLDLNIYYLSK